MTEENLFHVIHEPGDATKYEYYVLRLGYDIFKFLPENRFEYPTELNLGEIEDVTDVSKAHKYILGRNSISNKVNPHTLLQCIEVVKKIINPNYET